MAGTHNGSMLVRISRAELSEHLIKRIAHHHRRATDLATEAATADDEAEAALRDGETVSDRMRIKTSNSYTSTMSRRDQLRSRSQKHAVDAVVLQFLFDHLVPDEYYDVNRTELLTLELIPRDNNF